MILKEMKEQVLSLIEEINPKSEVLTDDPDISAKINYVINQIQNELARIKKIPVRDEMEVIEGQVEELSELVDDFYQLNLIKGVNYHIYDSTIEFLEDGKVTIYYYKYPKQITKDTDDNYKFELSMDVLQIAPYGIAGDLLKSDISANYGQVYSNRYRELLQGLDPRYHTGYIYIEEMGDINEFL